MQKVIWYCLAEVCKGFFEKDTTCIEAYVAPHRSALTGTPTDNKLDGSSSLWRTCCLLNPRQTHLTYGAVSKGVTLLPFLGGIESSTLVTEWPRLPQKEASVHACGWTKECLTLCSGKRLSSVPRGPRFLCGDNFTTNEFSGSDASPSFQNTIQHLHLQPKNLVMQFWGYFWYL